MSVAVRDVTLFGVMFCTACCAVPAFMPAVCAFSIVCCTACSTSAWTISILSASAWHAFTPASIVLFWYGDFSTLTVKFAVPKTLSPSISTTSAGCCPARAVMAVSITTLTVEPAEIVPVYLNPSPSLRVPCSFAVMPGCRTAFCRPSYTSRNIG